MSRGRRGAAEFVPIMRPRQEWPELVNVASAPRIDVTLHDGTVVDSRSEAWRAECEARHVLRLPTRARRVEYLVRVEAKRGATARSELEALALALWEAARAG